MGKDLIKAEIKLFASLRHDRFDIKKTDLERGTSVRELIELLGIKEEEVAIIFINGRHGDAESCINEGDTVALFPPVGGG